MALSSDLISQFVKSTKDDTAEKKDAIVYGTIVKGNGSTYVRLDGSNLLTPITTTTDVENNERVTVLIKNHTATVTGNITSPAARTTYVKKVADAIGTAAQFDTLEANDATIYGKLIAAEADIDSLQTDKLSVADAAIGYASISALNATNAQIQNLGATYATIANLNTTNARIDSLDTEYATIDFANIGEAAIEAFFSESGMIRDLVVSDGTITGEIVGVTIRGDRIIANTIAADKIVIRGDDGILYKLNTDGLTAADIEELEEDEVIDYVLLTSEPSDWSTNYSSYYVRDQRMVIRIGDKCARRAHYGPVYTALTTAETWVPNTYYAISTSETLKNSIHGSKIIANTITAEKISVNDLVAFDATIGGFHIGESSLYSGVKSSASNTTPGIYLDNSGQMAIGDSSHYLKYYKDQNNVYHLDISVDNVRLQSGQTVETFVADSVGNLKIGGRNLLRYTDFMDGSKWVKGGGATVANGIGTLTAVSGQQVEIYRKDPVDGKPGDKFTFSVNILTNTLSGGNGLRFYLYSIGTNSDETAYTTWPVNITLDSGYTGVYSYTWTVPDGVTITELGMDMDSYGCASGEATICHYKIERGEKATDWTIAPEDDEEYLSSSIDDVHQVIATTKSEIIDTSSEYSRSLLESYVEVDEYQTFKQDTQSRLTQTSDAITASFESTELLINNVDDDLQNKFNNLNKYIRFSGDGIEIGSSNNSLRLTLNNDKIAFSNNGTAIGWWDGTNFHTGNIDVELYERARFGNFAWVPRSDGSLMLLKVQ